MVDIIANQIEESIVYKSICPTCHKEYNGTFNVGDPIKPDFKMTCRDCKKEIDSKEISKLTIDLSKDTIKSTKVII